MAIPTRTSSKVSFQAGSRRCEDSIFEAFKGHQRRAHKRPDSWPQKAKRCDADSKSRSHWERKANHCQSWRDVNAGRRMKSDANSNGPPNNQSWQRDPRSEMPANLQACWIVSEPRHRRLNLASALTGIQLHDKLQQQTALARRVDV